MFIMKRMDVMGKMLREEIIRLPNISNMSVDIVIQWVASRLELPNDFNPWRVIHYNELQTQIQTLPVPYAT